jgi:hypothetical protein
MVYCVLFLGKTDVQNRRPGWRQAWFVGVYSIDKMRSHGSLVLPLAIQRFIAGLMLRLSVAR